MNNDLISREALKKKIQARHDNGNEDFDKGYNIGLGTAIDLIDNAPTVDIPTELCKGCRFLKDCETCEEKLRPQGKWIKIFENPFTNGYICSVCGHKIQVTEQFLPQVTECEVCGAEMKGGTE